MDADGSAPHASGSRSNSNAQQQQDELTFTTLTAAGAAAAAAGEQTFVVQEDLLGERRDSTATGGAGGGDGDPSNDDLLGLGGGDAGELREQDRFLPIANVARIMKKGIPSEQGKIAKDARECVQECVSEFISFITSEASDRCQAEKRKTINGEDILFAMSTLGFDNYVEPLKLYLQKYREGMKGDKGAGGDEFEDIGAEALMGKSHRI